MLKCCREDATGIADFDALEGKFTGRKSFAAVGNSPVARRAKSEKQMCVELRQIRVWGSAIEARMSSQTRELIEKSQQVNEGMISEMLVHNADHRTSVADLLKQITERTERSNVETLEHCKSMVTCMSESMLEQVHRQIHTVAQQQQADMKKLQEELVRTSRATLQIQRQSAEVQEQVRGMVSDVEKRLDESMSKQGAQLLNRCKQMLIEREQATRSLGQDNIGCVAVSTPSVSTCPLNSGKTTSTVRDDKVQAAGFGAAGVTDVPVVGSVVLPSTSSGILTQSPAVSSSSAAMVQQDNVLSFVGGALSPLSNRQLQVR